MIDDIVEGMKRNIQLTPKEIQKGARMKYRHMQVSLAASNIGRIQAAVQSLGKMWTKLTMRGSIRLQLKYPFQPLKRE